MSRSGFIKKSLLVVLAILLLALASVYLFIPAETRIQQSRTLTANKDALFRKLANGHAWHTWWPGKQEAGDTNRLLLLHGFRYTIGYAGPISIPVLVEGHGLSGYCEFTFLPIDIGRTTITADIRFAATSNPFTRIKNYFNTHNLEKDLSIILHAADTFSSSVRNLYGYDIQKKLVADSILVFTSESVKGYPDNNKIYSLVDALKDYVRQHAALETGYPMLNIYTPDSISYVVKVAIPVNKRLPDTGKIKYRWMLGGGNILITEVNGGPHEINKAYTQIRQYMTDYQRIAPAIPFESMVTDRRLQPDTGKWITRIYYPVI